MNHVTRTYFTLRYNTAPSGTAPFPGCDASPSLGCPRGMAVVFYMNRSFNCKEVDLKNKRLKTPEIQIILVRESALSHLDHTGLKSTQLMLYHA